MACKVVGSHLSRGEIHDLLACGHGRDFICLDVGTGLLPHRDKGPGYGDLSSILESPHALCSLGAF